MEYYEKVGLVSLDFNKISIPVLALCSEDDPLCRGECKLNLKIYIFCITLRHCVKFILERCKKPKLKYSPLKFLLPFWRSASKSRHLLYKTIFFFHRWCLLIRPLIHTINWERQKFHLSFLSNISYTIRKDIFFFLIKLL